MKVVFKQSEQQAMPTWGDIIGCVVTDKKDERRVYLVWGTTTGNGAILRDVNDMTKDLILSFDTHKLVDQSLWKIHRDVTLTVGE